MNYESPKMEIIKTNTTDIITTSGTTGGLTNGGDMSVGDADHFFG